MAPPRYQTKTEQGVQRRTVRYVAATLAATMALIYVLIGIGVLTVVAPADDDPSMLVFGASAGGAFLLGALLLIGSDRRVLWILGSVLQLLVVWGYLAVAPDRTPAFEAWGITLRVIQIPLFAALVYLGWSPRDRLTPVYRINPKGATDDEEPRYLHLEKRQHQGDR